MKERGMVMGFMLILFLWIVYPVIATIAIVILAIKNEAKKSRIQELLEERQGRSEMPAVIQVEKAAVPVKKAVVLSPLPTVDLPQVRRLAAPERKKIQVHPGLASLMIGVIFVVIAGLIFATTNWYLIPDLCKVIMVFGMSFLFFFSSKVAEKKLKIQRTGRAFYILGSVFLFLTVLAMGYFRVLGPGFELNGAGRWWVLWAGSVATEIAFLLGFSRYKERAFTWVYLGGLTVSVTFLMAALRDYGVGFANGMVCYAFVLLLAGWLNGRYEKKTGKGFLPDNALAVWDVFSTIHFAVFAGLMMPNILLGFYAVYGKSWLDAYRITPWNIFCTGLVAAGMAILAAGNSKKGDRTGCKVLYQLVVAVFLQYAAMGMPLAMEYRYLLAAMLQGGWIVLGRCVQAGSAQAGSAQTGAAQADGAQGVGEHKGLWTEAGDGIHTMAVAGNTAALLLNAIRWTAMLSAQLTASAAILVFTGVAILWSRKYPAVRRGILYLLGLLTVTGYGTCIYAGILEVRYNYLLFGYLVLAAIWDIVKKDCFWADILLMGAVPQVVSFLLPIKPAPFFLFLALYLFLKTREQEGGKERMLFQASCVCSLAGLYMELYWRLPNRVLAMYAVVGLWLAEYLVVAKRKETWREDGFWNVLGSAVFVALMITFYQDSGMTNGVGYGYLAVCLGLFYLIYGKLYLENSTFTHLPMAIIMLPLPWHLALVYDMTDGQILGGTAAVVLLSGILFRLRGPVHMADGTGEHTLRMDWYHILIGPVLVILAGAGGRGWESIYTLLLILYVLQFAMIKTLRKAAFTLALGLGIWFWWRQTFVTVPAVIWLESNLFPVAAGAAVFPVIWGKGRNVKRLQNGILAGCLLLLTVAAFHTGDVRDALILEIICLLAFLAAGRAKNRFWKNLSGTVLVLVVLYMTKVFWLSLSWWVYLLAAGIGLIAFAAWTEMNKKE